ncbi:uncharacterized protein LOC135488752 [Lineus longissimus]|uniref:uncharacterized protein LOC135488752 n=1 Tax=Lineus longissimus TaxID=88925 RepID=UPI002B4C44A8
MATITTNGIEELHDESLLYRRVHRSQPEDEVSTEGSEEEEEEKEKEEYRPFLYNKRVFVAFLPCFLFIFSLTGETFLYILATGSFIVHLLDNHENKQWAIMATIITFFSCQALVIYSVLPLLWNSLFNIFLIMFTNLYSVLSGGWVLLQFELFTIKDIAFAQVIEMMLFSIYPCSCTALMTWMMTILTSIQLAPYFFAIIGFVLFQLFLSTAPSSFQSGLIHDKEDVYILEPNFVGLLATIYLISPSIIYVICNMWLHFWGVCSIDCLVNLMFISSISVFLTTYLNTKVFLEHSGYTSRPIILARWISSLSGLLCFTYIIGKAPINSDLLFWIPMCVGLHAAVGMTLTVKHAKRLFLPFIFTLAVFYVYLLTLLPWNLQFTLQHVSIHVQSVYMLLFINVFLCLMCMVTSIDSSRRDLFNTLSVTSSFFFLVCEFTLHSNKLYLSILMPITSALISYFSLRMHYVAKLNPNPAFAILAMHIAKLLVLFQSSYSLKTNVTLLFWGYSAVVAFLLVFVAVKFIIHVEMDSLAENTLYFYTGGLGFLMLLNGPSLLSSIVELLVQDVASYSEILVLHFFFWGILCLKVTLTRTIPTQLLRHVSPALICCASLMLILRPQLQFSLISLLDWWLVMSVLASIVVLCGNVPLKTDRQILLPSIFIGAPCGLKAEAVLWSDWSVDFVRIWGSAVAGTCLAYLAFNLKCLSSKEVEKKIVKICVVLILSSVLLVIPDLLVMTSIGQLPSSPSLRFLVFSCLLPALLLKLYSMSDKVLDLGKEERAISKLPIVGNLFTYHTFVVLCLVCPIQSWDFWMCCSSLVFFLLQKDPYILRNLTRQNQATPTVSTSGLVLMMSTLIRNHIWTEKWIIKILQGLLELIVIAITVPNYVQLFAILWTGKIPLWDRYVVFLAPWNLFLLYGCSYQSWALGIFGLLSAAWMMIYKLPLQVDHPRVWR